MTSHAIFAFQVFTEHHPFKPIRPKESILGPTIHESDERLLDLTL